MTTIIPDEALDWYRDKGIQDNDVTSEFVYDIGVGDGAQTVSNSDTQLNNEIYRTNDDNANGDVSAGSITGKYTAEISVTGGSEVSSGADITELGVWARDPSLAQSNVSDSDDAMIFHEGFSPVTVNSGQTKTFTIEINITD